MPEKKTKVGIIGCGRGGSALLEILKDDATIEVRWIADMNPHAVGIEVSKKLNIPFLEDYKTAISDSLDIVINVTGSQAVGAEVKSLIPAGTELMGGQSALILWKLVDERRKRKDERDRVLREHENLYHLGLVIENIDNLTDAAQAIVNYATKMLNMPAGSMAILDDGNEEMKLVASKGFSPEFIRADRWKIRKGGLTDSVFKQQTPQFIKDILAMTDANPILIQEGVRSLIAAPLKVDGNIVGILYINDFKERSFSAEETSIFSLLTVYAALTIERARKIEAVHRMSIIDGLTDLYNHRYVMDVLKNELVRATRHGDVFSLIMLDIDDFKKYNDSFGHLEGNNILKAVARVFTGIARSTDTVGRFGGEEFCIIAPELDAEHAALFGRRLVEGVARHAFPNRNITISGGVATFPHDGRTVNDLIRAADDRLYKAKASGKNTVFSE